MRSEWIPLLCIVTVGACGRIGYDELSLITVDSAAIDSAASCPSDMTAIAPDATVCIELTERGTESWTVAKAQCETLGRRLCADLEWFASCVNAPGLVDMIDGGYEWVAEESGGVALKRGEADCTVMSSHAIVDPYEFRCCADL